MQSVRIPFVSTEGFTPCLCSQECERGTQECSYCVPHNNSDENNTCLFTAMWGGRPRPRGSPRTRLSRLRRTSLAGRRGRRPRTRGSAPLCVQDVFEGACATEARRLLLSRPF